MPGSTGLNRWQANPPSLESGQNGVLTTCGRLRPGERQHVTQPFLMGTHEAGWTQGVIATDIV